MCETDYVCVVIDLFYVFREDFNAVFIDSL